jgi:NitT/TauT family transport system substrate-binding protein
VVFIHTFLVFVLAWVSGRCFALDTLHVSYPSPAPFYIPVAVALQQGFFRDQNLDVKLIVTRAEVDRAALVSGDIDFTLRIGSTILSAARGLPVRTVFLSTLKPFWAFVVRPDINAVGDLKGKIVGSGGVAGSHYGTTKVILRKHGVDPDKEVTLKFIGPGERIPAVMAKSIDGVLMDYGEALRAKKAGLKILLNSADYYSLASAGVGASIKTLRDKPELTKRFLRAHVQAIRFMRERRDRTVDAIGSFLKVEKESADGVYQLCVDNFTKDGTLDDAALKPLVEEQLAGLNIKDTSLSQMFDFGLLQQVLKEAR